MATFVFTDGYVAINSVDVSASATKVSLDVAAELQDDTTMGDTARSRKAGLLDWSLTVERRQDGVDDGLDEDMFALIGAAAFPVAVRPDSGAIAVTNPEYTGSAVLESYKPIDGAVGDLAKFTATFKSAGTLTRDVTP